MRSAVHRRVGAVNCGEGGALAGQGHQWLGRDALRRVVPRKGGALAGQGHQWLGRDALRRMVPRKGGAPGGSGPSVAGKGCAPASGA
jgi:hypothetical protein